MKHAFFLKLSQSCTVDTPDFLRKESAMCIPVISENVTFSNDVGSLNMMEAVICVAIAVECADGEAS